VLPPGIVPPILELMELPSPLKYKEFVSPDTKSLRMNTRGHKNAKLSEDELEALRQTMVKQDERMQNEAASLQKQ